MKKTGDKKNRVQDVLVLITLLVFSTVLILGLVPREQYVTASVNSVFFNIVMMIPVVIAVYFIIISFRRRVSRDLHRVSTTIRTKLMLAILFAAIVPTLPITLISNNIINRAISELFSQDTQEALSEALEMSRDQVNGHAAELIETGKLYSNALDNGTIEPDIEESFTYIKDVCTIKNINCALYSLNKNSSAKSVEPLYVPVEDDFTGEFLSLITISQKNRLYRLNHDKEIYILSLYVQMPYIAVFYKQLPQPVLARELNFEKIKVRYEQQTFIMPHIQNAVGLALLILSIVIIVMSVALSYFLAQSITSPVYTLVDASKKIAEGDFSVRLNRGASDEISLLFNSYNEMAEKLKESRKILMHNQRLEVWKEVGSKLFHEIKNPLTPIRLSAERIQRKYKEKPQNLDTIIQSGTDTIIEEVDMLKHILGEFSRYTRMPELKRDFHDINAVLEDSVEAFKGHEEIDFQLKLDNTLPRLWIDRILLRQMMNNLIKNAIEAMNGHGTVFIRSEKKGGTVDIIIADTGPGISKKDIDHLFEATFSRKADGTGLGLAIVERTVVKHGGTISCISTPGQGAQFRIQLPIKGTTNGKGSDS